MKKKLVAFLLSAALGFTPALEAGAAAFGDEAGAVYSADLFTDDSETASGGTVFLNAAETAEEDSGDEAEPVIPAEEGESISGQNPDVSQDSGQAELFGEQTESDVELFSAGEVPGDLPVQEAPEIVFDREELLAAQAVLEPGSVIMAHWRKADDGRWRLIKSIEEETSGGETLGADPGTESEAPEQNMEQSSELSGEEMLQAGPDDGGTEPVQTSGGETVAETEILPEETAPGEEEPVESAGTLTYYDEKDGIVHIKTLQSAGVQEVVTEGDYLFDAEGYLVTGRKVVEAGIPGNTQETAKEFFFMDEANAKLLTTANVSCTPYNSNLGQMQKSYWLWTGTSFRYYSSQGVFLSVQELKKINEDKGSYTGYYKINKIIYCLDDEGVPREGFWDITDIKNPGSYYFLTKEESGDKIPGGMIRCAWRSRVVDGQTQWCYFAKNGRRKNLGIVAKKLDTSVMGDYYYLLDADGHILKSTMIQASNKGWYLSNSKGRIYRSALVKYQGARYYFNSSGKKAAWTNSWHLVASASNHYYYFGSNPGQVEEKYGWQLVKKANGKAVGWFYFAANGNHYKNLLSKNGCYFDENGKLAAGVHTVNGKTYFFQSSTTAEHKGVMYKKTWIHSRNKWYYAGSDGVLYQNGWKSIDNSWYYFQEDCTVLTNATATRNGVKGYVDSRGKFCTGWVVVSNANNLVKYVDPATGTFAVNRSVVVDGLTYWFDSNGYRLNDVTSKVSGPYYVEVDRVNGVMTIFNAARTIPVKSIRVSVGLPGTSTPTGRYTLTPAGRWQALMGPSWGQYATHVDGAGYGGIFVHSVACTYANSYNLPAGEYNKLGSAASHGCIRCCVADAKWVYEHCGGAKIYIFDGTYKADEVFKGPLGRRPLTPLRGSGNFDPTDPAVS